MWNNPLRRKNRNQQILNAGQLAEQDAEVYLTQQGLKLRERNYRCTGGEIDLVMIDDDQLVFVEVRYRKQSRFGSPLESVNQKKQQKLNIAAQHYLQTHKLSEKVSSRFDVIGITSDRKFDWIKNAF